MSEEFICQEKEYLKKIQIVYMKMFKLYKLFVTKIEPQLKRRFRK